ncbi:hypothetical protein CISG_03570 [Coccidioides immitis RMSCC 3703]|uniref:Uncharacterized protein n=1 Tax=Coccidioides immitis RMSCC 3703 TaxID=454286 RepID=A0A0J8QM07_COCIT|nr:hypothetical protein CISG_03570 [Coccidioides immitis RMSCC 3703]
MSFPNTFVQRIQTITKRGKAQSLAATFIQPQKIKAEKLETSISTHFNGSLIQTTFIKNGGVLLTNSGYVFEVSEDYSYRWELFSRIILMNRVIKVPIATYIPITEELSLKPWAKSSKSGGKDQSSQGTRKILDTKCCSTQSYSSMLKGGEENSSQSRGLFRSPRHLSALALRPGFWADHHK